MTINLLVWSTTITHHWWSWSTMQSTSFSSRFFNFLQSFHTEVWTVHRINRILLFSPQILVKSFVCNIIIDSSYNLSKYIQYKHVWKLFEVGCQHQHTLIPLYCLERNRKLLKCLRILITAVYFKDRKWISKTVYCVSCSMVCKIIFCSKFPDILNKAGRKKRRRRTQAIAKRYAFHANAINLLLIERGWSYNSILSFLERRMMLKRYFVSW